MATAHKSTFHITKQELSKTIEMSQFRQSIVFAYNAHLSPDIFSRIQISHSNTVEFPSVLARRCDFDYRINISSEGKGTK